MKFIYCEFSNAYVNIEKIEHIKRSYCQFDEVYKLLIGTTGDVFTYSVHDTEEYANAQLQLLMQGLTNA